MSTNENTSIPPELTQAFSEIIEEFNDRIQAAFNRKMDFFVFVEDEDLSNGKYYEVYAGTLKEEYLGQKLLRRAAAEKIEKLLAEESRQRTKH